MNTNYFLIFCLQACIVKSDDFSSETWRTFVCFDPMIKWRLYFSWSIFKQWLKLLLSFGLDFAGHIDNLRGSFWAIAGHHKNPLFWKFGLSLFFGLDFARHIDNLHGSLGDSKTPWKSIMFVFSSSLFLYLILKHNDDYTLLCKLNLFQFPLLKRECWGF